MLLKTDEDRGIALEICWRRMAMWGDETMFPNFHLQLELATTSINRSWLLFNSFIQGYFSFRHTKYLFRKLSWYRDILVYLAKKTYAWTKGQYSGTLLTTLLAKLIQVSRVSCAILLVGIWENAKLQKILTQISLKKFHYHRNIN